MSEKFVRFKFDINQESDQDIRVNGYRTVMKGGHYMSMGFYIAPKTIPDLIRILSDEALIKAYSIQDVIENEFDSIHFLFRGSDQNPVFTISIDKHVMKNGTNYETGTLSIPLSSYGLGDDMEYIRPFVEELKKFLPDT